MQQSGPELRASKGGKRHHTKRDALRAMESLGAPDKSLGAFIYRVRAAGLADERIGRLLGFPPDTEGKSLRLALNRWERADGFRTAFDAQARADVAHARNRWTEAAGRLAAACPLDSTSDAELAHLLLDAELPATAAAPLEDFLSRWVEWWAAEIKAGVLNLPRDVMPGAIPISWAQIKNRIEQLREQLTAAERRRVVAGYIETHERQRDRVGAWVELYQDEITRKTESVLADLEGHPEAEAILRVLRESSDATAQDALGRRPVELDESYYEPKIQRKRPLVWGPRKHLADRDGRAVLLEQWTAGLRIGIPTKRR